MTTTLTASELDSYEVSPDGTVVRLGFRLSDGEIVRLELPGEHVAPLAMSLPRIAKLALARRYRDPSLRLVFPVGEWRVEQSERLETALLTLATEDGFEACYAIALADLDGLSASVAATMRPKTLRN
jgi:hypothetical protein